MHSLPIARPLRYVKIVPIFTSRAPDLEEHQQNFDAACADYDRLYVLSYKDPQWMLKSAQARARPG